MIEEGLYSYLSSQGGIVSLVGTRIFPGMVPIGEYPPAITYQNVSENRQDKYCGVGNTVRSDFIINSFDKSALKSRQIADAVKAALKDFSGMMGSEKVIAVFLATQVRDLADPEPGFFYTSQTFVIWHVET